MIARRGMRVMGIRLGNDRGVLSQTVIREALGARAWRQRCGEPALHRWPVRCSRALGHLGSHLGFGVDDHSLLDIISWPGTGNTASAACGRHYRCWCP